MNKEITIYLIDRMGVEHKLIAPVDFNLNLMELIKSYEFPVEATCGGMALCASALALKWYVHGHRFENEIHDKQPASADETQCSSTLIRRCSGCPVSCIDAAY